MSTPALSQIDKLTQEILSLKADAVNNILAIGKKLIEAKSTISHGEWKEWLDVKVQFSQETARKMMRVSEEFREYDRNIIKKLGTEKLYLLLSVPKEKREHFENEYACNSLDEISTRDLKKAITDFKEDDLESSQEKPFQIQKHLKTLKGELKKVTEILSNQNLKLESLQIVNPYEEQHLHPLGDDTAYHYIERSETDSLIKNLMSSVTADVTLLSELVNNLEVHDQWNVEYTKDNVKEKFQGALEFGLKLASVEAQKIVTPSENAPIDVDYKEVV